MHIVMCRYVNGSDSAHIAKVNLRVQYEHSAQATTKAKKNSVWSHQYFGVELVIVVYYIDK